MGRVNAYIKQFHPIVWVLLIGTIVARGSMFMTLPFLAIYLSRDMVLHTLLVGVTIGISPLVATFAGFIGGHLSDRFGRKPVMLASLFGLALVFLGFAITTNPIVFILLNAMNGLCNSFFEPTSQALIADLTEKSKRMKAFSLRYTAINIGASVGPLLGAYLAYVSAKSTFVITGSVYFLYGVVLMYLMSRITFDIQTKSTSKVSLGSALKMLQKDKALFYLIAGGILVNIGYSQIQSNVPLHLESTLENGVYLYSILLSINAIMVVFLQIPISHFAEKYPPMQAMVVGAILMSIGLVGIGLTNGWIMGVIAITLITVGEILIFPSNSVLIDQLANEGNRGLYFGASQFRKIGNFFGPIIGGSMLTHIGGGYTFAGIAAITIASILLFTVGNRRYSETINIQKSVSHFN